MIIPKGRFFNMKKASKILLTIGGIINIVGAVAAIIAGLVLAIMSFAGGGFILEYLQQAGAEMPEDMPVDGAIILAIIAGLICLFAGVVVFILLLVSGIIAVKASKKNVKGSFIACIVWSVLTENIFLLVGGILGIIGLNKENNQPQPEPESAPAPLPEPAPAPEPAPVQEEPKEEAKPAPAPARKDWFCPKCGAHNEGKFCASCGTKKPE